MSFRTVWTSLALMVAVLALPAAAAAAPARYSVRTYGDVVQLRDGSAGMVVSVLTPVSNAYEIVVKGTNVLRTTFTSVDQMRARPGLNGVPLLWPFANRLDETAFYANGRKYAFDLGLGNVRGPVPIHGYLSGASEWKVVEAKADARGAWVTTRMEFYRVPMYMAQFPFAHTLTMTYRVSAGALEVRTRIDNLATEPFPVTIGWHPYFQLTDSNRADWTLSTPARTHLLLDNRLIPTGKTEPAANFWGGDPKAVPLSRFADKTIDEVFTDLDRDAQGRATVSIQGARQKVSVVFGPKYKGLVIFSTPAPAPPRPAAAAPAGAAPAAAPPPVSVGPPIPLSATRGEPAPPARGFVAMEPMAGVSNAMNAAQAGTYRELQTVAPGGYWQESFWIKPSGY